jgi:hypothetical protein
MAAQHRIACAHARHRTIAITLARLALLLAVFLLVPFVPDDALGKGGTNMHEGLWPPRPGAPTDQLLLPQRGFEGCGRGRYRDPRTHRCRGPGDFGN